MLQRMDQLDLFPQTQTGPFPFLLLYGHGSRLQLPFLRYINNTEHIWRVCIGMPNGTAHWQVSDSPEQNGSWKMATTAEKRSVSNFQDDNGHEHYDSQKQTQPKLPVEPGISHLHAQHVGREQLRGVDGGPSTELSCWYRKF